jgi:hypothetical protein
MFKRKLMAAVRPLVATILMTGLLGCAQAGPTIVKNEESSLYSINEYNQDAATGDVVVVVRGGLPGVTQQVLENFVVAHMQGADWGPHAHFTATPGPNTARTFWYAMLINGPKNLTASALCANPSTIYPPDQTTPPGHITLVAGICRNTHAMMGVSGQVDGVMDLTDIKFHQLITAAVQQLTGPRIDSPSTSGSEFLYIH